MRDIRKVSRDVASYTNEVGATYYLLWTFGQHIPMILYRGYESGEAKAKNPERYSGAVAGYSKLRLLLQNCIPVAAQYIRMQGLKNSV